MKFYAPVAALCVWRESRHNGTVLTDAAEPIHLGTSFRRTFIRKKSTGFCFASVARNVMRMTAANSLGLIEAMKSEFSSLLPALNPEQGRAASY
jgi:hypothetical protein